jgi:hypothetical protein
MSMYAEHSLFALSTVLYLVDMHKMGLSKNDLGVSTGASFGPASFLFIDFVYCMCFKLKLFKYPDLSAGDQKRDLEEIPLGKQVPNSGWWAAFVITWFICSLRLGALQSEMRRLLGTQRCEEVNTAGTQVIDLPCQLNLTNIHLHG